MRIAELSEQAEVSIPTIKYYLREGLLPRGEATGRNQARYGAGHLRRLRLIRALTTVGGLPVATVRTILAEVDEPGLDIHDMLGRVMPRIPTVKNGISPEEADLDRARALVAERGWHSYEDDPNLDALAMVFAAHREAGHPLDDEALNGYAAAIEPIARIDLDRISSLPEPEEVLEGAVVKTVLGDTLMVVLRRLAQVHESAARLKDPSGDD